MISLIYTEKKLRNKVSYDMFVIRKNLSTKNNLKKEKVESRV